MTDEPEIEKYTEMIVAGVVVDPTSNAPILVLKDQKGGACLPIWIGAPEANSITAVLKKAHMDRPNTHDLLSAVVMCLGGKVARVAITALSGNTYDAIVELCGVDGVGRIECRLSDAIALAVRVGCPIHVAQSVLASAQIPLVKSSEDVKAKSASSVQKKAQDVKPTSIQESEKRPLDDFSADEVNLSATDRDSWLEVLGAMNPADFKYKM